MTTSGAVDFTKQLAALGLAHYVPSDAYIEFYRPGCVPCVSLGFWCISTRRLVQAGGTTEYRAHYGG